MVVGFTTTCAISTYHHLSCEFEPRHGKVLFNSNAMGTTSGAGNANPSGVQ
jgi:hypothetical protein